MSPQLQIKIYKGLFLKNEQGNFQDIDYIILAPPFLIGQAERLAAFHRSNSNLNTKVVNLNTLYMEFGGAKQDIAAIRNFMKYVYFNASSPSKRVKYLNLFGDASFDYKKPNTKQYQHSSYLPIIKQHNFYGIVVSI